MEPREGSHPSPIASASQAAGLRPVVPFTVLAMGSGLAWPIALCTWRSRRRQAASSAGRGQR